MVVPFDAVRLNTPFQRTNCSGSVTLLLHASRRGRLDFTVGVYLSVTESIDASGVRERERARRSFERQKGSYGIAFVGNLTLIGKPGSSMHFVRRQTDALLR